jgi:hypothetical protein
VECTIRDGQLSVSTWALLYGAAIRFWHAGFARIRRLPNIRIVLLVAVASAFCFVINDIQHSAPQVARRDTFAAGTEDDQSAGVGGGDRGGIASRLRVTTSRSRSRYKYITGVVKRVSA